MDDIGLMVDETFRHHKIHFLKEEINEEEESLPEDHEVINLLPEEAGLIYHLQKSTSLFVIRTLVVHNIKETYLKILQNPEEYPSLRLLEGGSCDVEKKLRFHIFDEISQAEVVHDQINNRRFPIFEESICNLSDPGFSWWLSPKNDGFQISFTLSVHAEGSTKLGPLGDHGLALKFFQKMEEIVQESGLVLNIQNEVNRVQFNQGEEFILTELKDLFELGVIGEGLTSFFSLMSKRVKEISQLETLWFYLKELAAMRRFWIQVEYDLGND